MPRNSAAAFSRNRFLKHSSTPHFCEYIFKKIDFSIALFHCEQLDLLGPDSSLYRECLHTLVERICSLRPGVVQVGSSHRLFANLAGRKAGTRPAGSSVSVDPIPGKAIPPQLVQSGSCRSRELIGAAGLHVTCWHPRESAPGVWLSLLTQPPYIAASIEPKEWIA